MRLFVLAAASLISCTLFGTPSFAQSYYSVVEVGVSGDTIWVDVVPHPNGIDTCGGIPLPCWQAFASLDVQPCPLNKTCSGGTYYDNRYADSNGSGSNIFTVARLALDVNETYTIGGFYHIDYWPPGPDCMNGPPYCVQYDTYDPIQYSWPLPTFTISGYVRTSGAAPIDGVVMNGLPGPPSTDASGHYSASVPAGWSGVVTPTKSGFTFVPASASYSNVWADQTQDYIGPTFSTVSGYVRTATGTAITGVVMSGLPGPPSTDGTGYYSASVSAGWSGTVTPTKGGYTFSPPSATYSNVVTNQIQDYVGQQVFTISGYVRTATGTAITGVAMSGLPGPPSTDGTGYYSSTVSAGWSGTVTPTKAGFVFVPASTTYTDLAADRVDNYTGTGTYTISGYTRTSGGLAISGVVMSGLPGNPSTDGAGYYSASAPQGWSGTVTPSKASYTFFPSSATYNNLGQNILADYVGSQGFSISGHVRTLGGQGIGDVVMNGLPGNPSTDENGFYSAPVEFAWFGTATPVKAGYTFDPASVQYSNVMQDVVTNYTGTNQTFTIWGLVTTSSGSPITGVTLSGLPGNPVTTETGIYWSQVGAGWSGTVTPTKASFTFTPLSTTYTNVAASQQTNYIGEVASAIFGLEPGITALAAGSPNPFRQSVTLPFGIGKSGPVDLAIYSVDGRRIRTVVSGYRRVGTYLETWEGRDDQGAVLNTGVYWVRLKTSEGSFTRKLVLVQ